MPLVNEVVIGLKDKDKFNGSEPKDDAQFADYVTNPSLPVLVELVFGAPTGTEGLPARRPGAAFLTGVPSVNAAEGLRRLAVDRRSLPVLR